MSYYRALQDDEQLLSLFSKTQKKWYWTVPYNSCWVLFPLRFLAENKKDKRPHVQKMRSLRLLHFLISTKIVIMYVSPPFSFPFTRSSIKHHRVELTSLFSTSPRFAPNQISNSWQPTTWLWTPPEWCNCQLPTRDFSDFRRNTFFRTNNLHPLFGRLPFPTN